MKLFLNKYQILIFFALTFFVTWMPWMVKGSGWFIWGPSLVGIMITTIVAGKKGLRELLLRVTRWRVGILWYLIAILVPIATSLAANGVQHLLGGPIPTFTFIQEKWYLLPPLFLLVMFFPLMGPVAEEFGWRGYALPRLQERWGALVASLIIGTAWGLWHLPEFFTPGTAQFEMGIGMLVPFTISEIAISIIMTWLYNNTKGSLLIAGLMAHTAFNFLGTLLITEATIEAFKEGAIVLPDSRLILVMFGILTLVALVLVLMTKGQLGYRKIEES